MEICVGGTFNIFHKGHKLLLQTAVETAGNDGKIFIGITSGKLIEKKPCLRDIHSRIKDVQSFLSTLTIKPIIEIQPITNKYGPTLNKNFDAIIVSPGTKKNADIINHKRKEKGLKKIRIIEIPYVMAYDGKPIQSSRIITGEINKNGEKTENHKRN
jgi:pantetheine-phosphate adenylyltransferase